MTHSQRWCVGELCPQRGISPTFGRGTIVMTICFLGAIDTKREAFKEGFIRREGDLKCRLKIS